MALPTSGTIRISNIRDEFGGTGARALSSYKRGGGLVPNHEQNANIPTTNSNIALSKFYGTARNFEAILNSSVTTDQVGYIKDSFGSMNFTFVGKTFDASSAEIIGLFDNTPAKLGYVSTSFGVTGDQRGTWWSSIIVTSPSLGTKTISRSDTGSYSAAGDATTWVLSGGPAFFGTEIHNVTITMS
jgi:hypothetical protein